MDLKELGEVMVQAIALRGMLDALDEKLATSDALIAADRQEISRLQNLEAFNQKSLANRELLAIERGKQQAELSKRLKVLEEVGVRLPLAEKFGARRVAL